MEGGYKYSKRHPQGNHSKGHLHSNLHSSASPDSSLLHPSLLTEVSATEYPVLLGHIFCDNKVTKRQQVCPSLHSQRLYSAPDGIKIRMRPSAAGHHRVHGRLWDFGCIHQSEIMSRIASRHDGRTGIKRITGQTLAYPSG